MEKAKMNAVAEIVSALIRKSDGIAYQYPDIDSLKDDDEWKLKSVVVYGIEHYGDGTVGTSSTDLQELINVVKEMLD